MDSHGESMRKRECGWTVVYFSRQPGSRPRTITTSGVVGGWHIHAPGFSPEAAENTMLWDVPMEVKPNQRGGHEALFFAI